MARQHLVENIQVTPKQYKKQPLNESTELRVSEAGGDQTYKALAVYTFPISRPDEKNLNGRIYTSKLWEKVIKEKQADGCYGLMDHPQEDGSTKDYWCVWRNLRFSEDRKLILADAYLFGMWGKQVLEALEAGGSIGLSSSGWGEFNDDNTTLNEETYLLERVADHVLNPSYEVFGHQEDLVTSNESVDKKDENWDVERHSAEIADNLRKDNPNYNVYVAKPTRDLKLHGRFTDKTWGDYDAPVNKYFDRSKDVAFTLYQKDAIVIVEKPTKDGAYITVYPDAWYYVNEYYYEELMESISIIRNESNSLESSPKNNKEIAMENTRPASSPSIEEKSLLLNIKSMFKETKQITNVFERQEGYNSLLSYFDEKLSESGIDLKNEIEKAFKEDEELIHSQIEKYPEICEKATTFESKVSDLEKSLAEANEKLSQTEASLKEAEEKLSVITKENAVLESKFAESCEMLDNFKAYANKQKEITRTLEAEKNGMVTPKEYKESIVYAQSLEEELKKVKAELYETKKSKKEDDDEDEPEKQDEPEDDDNDKDDGEDKDDLDKIDDKNKKKESFINEGVEDYYRDLAYRNPKVVIIKEDIMKCRTVLEAQMTYLRLKGLVDESSSNYYDRANKAVSKIATKEEKNVKRSALREGWI